MYFVAKKINKYFTSITSNWVKTIAKTNELDKNEAIFVQDDLYDHKMLFMQQASSSCLNMNASNESKSKRERLNFLRECVRDIKRERDRERVTVKTKSVCVERERENLYVRSKSSSVFVQSWDVKKVWEREWDVWERERERERREKENKQRTKEGERVLLWARSMPSDGEVRPSVLI